MLTVLSCHCKPVLKLSDGLPSPPLTTACTWVLLRRRSLPSPPFHTAKKAGEREGYCQHAQPPDKQGLTTWRSPARSQWMITSFRHGNIGIGSAAWLTALNGGLVIAKVRGDGARSSAKTRWGCQANKSPQPISAGKPGSSRVGSELCLTCDDCLCAGVSSTLLSRDSHGADHRGVCLPDWLPLTVTRAVLPGDPGVSKCGTCAKARGLCTATVAAFTGLKP